MPKRERREETEPSPVATRPKATPPSRPDRWTNQNSRAEESSRHKEPFNVFSQSTKSHRFCPSRTDDSDNRNKVVLRSNSEIRRDHHRTDLTAWRTLTVPTPCGSLVRRTYSRMGSTTHTRYCIAIIKFSHHASSTSFTNSSTRSSTSTAFVHSFSAEWRPDYQCARSTT